MTQVQTVRGPVEAAELGLTLAHEHVFVLTPDLLAQGLPETWDEEARVADAVVKLRRVAALGVRTIVDPTVVGLGRYLPRVQRVNAEVDLHIVAATGLYTYAALPPYLGFFGPGTPFGGEDPLVAMMLRDLGEGIGGTGVRAGVLKCAVDAPGLLPGPRRVLDAVAEVHGATGTPVLVHTSVHNDSPEQVLDVLRDSGADLGRVVLGHVGDSTDVGRLKSLADAGALLGMDRFGLDALLATEQRVDTVVRLCADGYAGRMVLSRAHPPRRAAGAAGARRDRGADHHHARRRTPPVAVRGLTVPEAGIEPACPLGQTILSRPCLPFHHSGAPTGARRGSRPTVASPT